MSTNRIKEILSSRGLNVSNLADMLGVSRQALSRQISGKMLLETAERIADALGVELWELFADGREIAARYQEQGAQVGELLCPHCGNECELHVQGSRIELRTPTPWKK